MFLFIWVGTSKGKNMSCRIFRLFVCFCQGDDEKNARVLLRIPRKIWQRGRHPYYYPSFWCCSCNARVHANGWCSPFRRGTFVSHRRRRFTASTLQTRAIRNLLGMESLCNREGLGRGRNDASRGLQGINGQESCLAACIIYCSPLLIKWHQARRRGNRIRWRGDHWNGGVNPCCVTKADY